MAIPKYHQLFSNVLAVLADGQEWRLRDCLREVAQKLGLTEDELSQTMSGGGNRVENRVYWASVYLFQSKAIERPKRGYVRITDYGRDLLQKYPVDLPLATLEETEGLQGWYQRTVDSRAKRAEVSGPEFTESDDTPDERIANAAAELNKALAAELLELLHGKEENNWEFLERAVLKVLHAMGYGNSLDDLTHLGKTNDGGVDGVINQDKLGLDQIYVQAKCNALTNTIGRPVVQSFVGAVTGKKASRGVFITTSTFTKDAFEYAEGLAAPRIILIDGARLTSLMIENEIGVTVEKHYKVYKPDENFFGL